jgi:hypothetical protein
MKRIILAAALIALTAAVPASAEPDELLRPEVMLKIYEHILEQCKKAHDEKTSKLCASVKAAYDQAMCKYRSQPGEICPPWRCNEYSICLLKLRVK